MSDASTPPPTLRFWLNDLGRGDLTSMGLHPLVLFQLVSTMRDLPVMPDPVLQSWARKIGMEQLIRLQSIMRFIKEARQANWADERIAQNLGLPDDQSLLGYIKKIKGEERELNQNPPGGGRV